MNACFYFDKGSGGEPSLRRQASETSGDKAPDSGNGAARLQKRNHVIARRLRRRNHVIGGAGIAGACVREQYPPDSLDLHVPPLHCPVYCLQSAITVRASPKRRLFPNWGGKKVLTGPRGFARAKGWGGSARLGPHSFSGGIARAITRARWSVRHNGILPRSAGISI